MTVIIPAMSLEQQRIEVCPLMEQEGLIGKQYEQPIKTLIKSLLRRSLETKVD